MSGFLCSMVGASFTVTTTVNVLRGAKTITANGNAQVSTAQSKFGGASALFDGTGDYLFLPSNSDFGFGTGDFTLEGWFRFTNFTNGPALFDLRASGGTEVKPVVYCGSDGVIYYYVNGATAITGNTLSANTWYHIALSRSSGVTKLFRDGTQIGSNYTDTNNYPATVVSIGIASWNTSFNALNGYVDEVRISNSARYTTGFTPSTTPFVNDANTLLLIHANGTNASTVFTDDNGARAQNGISAIGNAQVDTAQSKFGGASALFDGTGDYVKSPAGTQWDFGTSSFTIEYWIRFNAINTLYVPIALRSSASIGAGEWWCEITAAENKMYWGFKNQAGTQYYVNLALAGTAFATGQFYHIALVNNAGTAQMYVNGTATGTTTSLSGSFGTSGTDLWVGAGAGAYSVNGWMDEVRISNTARYTAGFTPTTAPFVNDATTVFLMHADGTDASTVFTDDNSILNVTSAATSVDEGSSLTFNVATQNLANQTLYYSLSNAGDFATSTGSFSLTNNAGSFSVTPTADTTTEGAETFTASVRIGSTSGTVIATSSSVTINDTSLTPAFSPAGQAAVSSVINYAYGDYSQSSMAYVGPDSSNRPVFLFAYANGSNNLKAQLFRINDDGTITQGSEQGPGSNQSCSRTVKCMSEYEGANSFGNGSPTNYAYLTYADGPGGSNYKVQAVLADPSALTCTFGTAVSIGQTPDADQPAVAYVGNSRCVTGGRTGGGFGPKRYSRSGTTLTAEGTASADFDSRIDMDLLGFDWDGSSRYRMGQVVTQGGASGTLIAAAQQGATNYLVKNSTIGSTGFNMGCNLNNTNKMLAYSDGGGLNLRAVSITWNSAANPTLTIGTANAGFNDKSVGAAIVSGHVADEAYIVYNGSSTTLDYRKVTVSGTTVTIGSKVTMLTGLSSFYYQISPSSATVGTKKYLAGVAVRGSGAPYIFGYRLA